MARTVTHNDNAYLCISYGQVRRVAHETSGLDDKEVIKLRRSELSLLTLRIHEIPESARKDLPDLPPPLTPSEELTLSIQINDEIGSGRTGTTFKISYDELQGYNVPPLVVKVAVNKSCEDLKREASVYNELWFLQGSKIPRCYGHFELQNSSTKVGFLVLEELGGELPLEAGSETILSRAKEDIREICNTLVKYG